MLRKDSQYPTAHQPLDRLRYTCEVSSIVALYWDIDEAAKRCLLVECTGQPRTHPTEADTEVFGY
ncbi:hypothetical protein E2C01_085142 [Portunus trituberculatus]|uniref:Uncharacterized protein n=1 Tax=Portunus trituberculatus TaxID=210409 RepID=A0A5B7J5Z4_PORTR|nr:hypothetical protein [Portunus trituberculatus]